jgi:hypothetical protein
LLLPEPREMDFLQGMIRLTTTGTLPRRRVGASLDDREPLISGRSCCERLCAILGPSIAPVSSCFRLVSLRPLTRGGKGPARTTPGAALDGVLGKWPGGRGACEGDNQAKTIPSPRQVWPCRWTPPAPRGVPFFTQKKFPALESGLGAIFHADARRDNTLRANWFARCLRFPTRALEHSKSRCWLTAR